MTLDFLGIGARKCATSWIAKCLGEHPDICMPREKELLFFYRDDLYQRGFSYYESFFSTCKSGQIRGEFSTKYFRSREAIDRIAADAPRVKLILSLRNPVDRTISYIRHAQSKGNLPEDISLQHAISQRPRSLETSKYAQRLAHILDYFSRDQLCIVLVDDIERAPKRVMRELYRFLGVDSTFVPPSLYIPQNTSAQRLSTVNYWRNKLYLQLRKNAGGRAAIALSRRIKAGSMLNRISADTIPGPSREERAAIAAHFVDDIEQVEQLLGRDLSAWKKA